MNVGCPHCGRTYLLPETLLGPGGARVRCPACGGAFRVGADGAVGAGDPVAAPAEPAPPPDVSPAGLARSLLEELERGAGEALARDAAAGRLLSRHGPALLDAFDAWRRASGPRADVAAFRDEVRRRYGVDLTPLPGPAAS